MPESLPPLAAPEIAGQTAILETQRLGEHEYRFFRIPDLDRLLDQIDPAAFEKDERMPYWAELWPSGVALATMLAGSGLARGSRVLEIGCGLGLPSIVAARMGAYVVATDYLPEALELVETNAALNGVTVRTRELDWRNPGDIGRYDLVLAADVLYEKWQVDRVAEMFRRTVLPTGRGILVDPDRLTAKGFASAATFRGFRVDRRRVEDVGAARGVSVYELTWR